MSSLRMLSHTILSRQARFLGLSPQRLRSSSTPNGNPSVLAHSTLLLQDGLEIQELPLIIRRMSVGEYPFTSIRYSGDEPGKFTEEENFFNEQLKACSNVRHIFKLLEVPGDTVSTNSAAMALQRLCQLQSASGTNLSFVRKAIFNELCDTATTDSNVLSNKTMISLARCYLVSNDYSEVYIRRINDEIERRIGDGVFSIPELVSIVKLFSEHPKGSSEVVTNLWMHLGLRYHDIEESNVGDIFQNVQYMSPKHYYLVDILDKRINKFWWKLNKEDVQVILKNHRMLNRYNAGLLKNMAEWFFVNIHEVNDLDLQEFLATYSHFDQYSPTNGHFIRTLERYTVARIHHMDRTMVAMVMDYLKKVRYLSPRIMETVAADFIKNGEKYQAHQMFYALRVFGLLGYLPQDSGPFFTKIEEVLLDRFPQFQAYQVVELLTSFAYLQRIPINFVNKVYTTHFLAQLSGLPESMRMTASRHLQELYSACRLEKPNHVPHYAETALYRHQQFMIVGKWFKYHVELGNLLREIVDEKLVKDTPNIRGLPYFVDYELRINDSGELVNPYCEQAPNTKSIAVVSIMPEHQTINTQTFLGQYLMRQRHLEMLGYDILEIHTRNFPLLSTKSNYNELRAKLAALLKDTIKTAHSKDS